MKVITTLPLLFALLLANTLFAENILYQENFDSCDGLATGFTVSGVDTDNNPQVWTVGVSNNPFALGSSIDGSCMVYIDDNAAGTTSILDGPAIALSPTFDGSAYAKIVLEFDLHFRADDNMASYLELTVSNGTESGTVLTTRSSTNGDTFDNFTHQVIDISDYRGSSMAFVLSYDDGGSQAWWAGVDNIKVIGYSSITCANAHTLTVNEPTCAIGGNTLNVFEGDMPACVTASDGAVWYAFAAPASGAVNITTNAQFNDVLTVLGGACGSFTEIACKNTDEFGFEGESLNVQGLTPAQMYYIRLSGVLGTFGAASGDFCLQVLDAPVINTPPNNDLCADAIAIGVGAACTAGNNYYADADGPVPSLNNRSRNSVWYTFDAPASGNDVMITTAADFSDVITVFDGSCANFTEIACNDLGHDLLLSGLTANATYYIHISSYFSTIAGNFCIAVNEHQNNAPSNDLCANATALTVGSACTMSTNEMAAFEGVYPSCEIKPAASIWFSFEAPATGNIGINTGADFIHVLGVYSGTCGFLQEEACFNNPYRCDGDVVLNNLSAGDTYYLQITAAENPFGYMNGSVCIGLSEVMSAPVELQVRAALQGAYDTNANEMSTALSANGLVPTEQPFGVAPWNYNGQECIAASPNNMVDWVLVELRDAADDNSIVDRKAALLLANGTIIDSGRDGVSFANATENTAYYVVIRHRNHLDVMSSVAVTIPNDQEPYDFTSAATQAAGAQLADLGNGTFALLAGDIDANGVLTVADFNQYLNQAAAINQYVSSDCDMNASVTVADFNAYRPNASIIGMSAIRY